MSYRADKHVVTAHTNRHTDRQTQATAIPEGQNWPRVKTLTLTYFGPFQGFEKIAKNLNFDMFQTLGGPKRPEYMALEGHVWHTLESTSDMLVADQVLWSSSKHTLIKLPKTLIFTVWDPKRPTIWSLGPMFNSHLKVTLICLWIKFHGHTVKTLLENGKKKIQFCPTFLPLLNNERNMMPCSMGCLQHFFLLQKSTIVWFSSPERVKHGVFLWIPIMVCVLFLTVMCYN